MPPIRYFGACRRTNMLYGGCSPHICGSVCPINYLRGVRGKSGMRACRFWPLTGPQVNVLGIHLRRGICADAEERLYTGRPASKILGHIFPQNPPLSSHWLFDYT